MAEEKRTSASLIAAMKERGTEEQYQAFKRAIEETGKESLSREEYEEVIARADHFMKLH